MGCGLQKIRSVSKKLENHLEASKLFLPGFFWIFWDRLQAAKQFYHMYIISSSLCCKKIELKWSTERKVMPVLPKVTQVTRFQGHNSADWPAAVRAKLPYPRHTKRLSKVSQLGQSIPGICSNSYRQMKSRKAAMQGEQHKAACNLSRAGAAGSHTRRLARASWVMGWINLLFG